MTIAISGTSGITQTGSFDSSSTFGFKNRIINGAMVIDQRNAGASVTPTTDGQYTLDRMQVYISAASKFSVQKDSTVYPTGFTSSAKITSLAATSLAAGDYYCFLQPIEGFNVADLGFGASGASTVTISFWVRSSLTGTFGGALRNGAANRGYPFTYTISSANTWEQKTITIAGDTTGTWATGSTQGMAVIFGLGVGTTNSGTAGAWAASGYISATGATSVVGTLNATFYITGVQLEKGSTATSFDYRPYGTELQLAQRYYFKTLPGAVNVCFAMAYNINTTTAAGLINFPTAMRTAPSALEQSGTANQYMIAYLATSTQCTSVPTFSTASLYGSSVVFTVGAGLTAGQSSQLRTDGTNGVTAYLAWSAEL